MLWLRTSDLAEVRHSRGSPRKAGTFLDGGCGPTGSSYCSSLKKTKKVKAVNVSKVLLRGTLRQLSSTGKIGKSLRNQTGACRVVKSQSNENKKTSSPPFVYNQMVAVENMLNGCKHPCTSNIDRSSKDVNGVLPKPCSVAISDGLELALFGLPGWSQIIDRN